MSMTRIKDVVLPALEKFWAKIEVKLNELNEKLDSFEQTKSDIVGSGLGTALGMSTSIKWTDLVTKIKSVTNQGAKTSSLNCGGSYTIPAGYHNGSGKVTVTSLASNIGTSVTLDNNARLLSGYTAYGKNGTKYTGSVANKGNLNWSSSNTTYSVPAGYYSGGTLDSRPSYNAGYNAGTVANNYYPKNVFVTKTWGDWSNNVYSTSLTAGRYAALGHIISSTDKYTTQFLVRVSGAATMTTVLDRNAYREAEKTVIINATGNFTIEIESVGENYTTRIMQILQLVKY